VQAARHQVVHDVIAVRHLVEDGIDALLLVLDCDLLEPKTGREATIWRRHGGS
jgi:hypothetical protein